MPLVPLDSIAEPAEPARRAADPQADAALQASIAELGLLQPPLLRPRGNDGYEVVAGNRRVRACRALGFAQINAVVEQMNDGRALGAAVAENAIREPMPVLDTWRAARALRAQGFTIDHVAMTFGITARHAMQLEKLSTLHPDVLALIDTHGMPGHTVLATIANATHATQLAAAKSSKASAIRGALWDHMDRACRAARIPRHRAIFDIGTAGVAFEEDLFLPPEAQERDFTADVAGFLAAQRKALEEEAASSKGRLKLVKATRAGFPDIPKEFVTTDTDPEKPKRGETVFACVVTEGTFIGDVVRFTAKPKPKPDAKTEKNKAATAKSAPPPDDDDTDEPVTAETDAPDPSDAPAETDGRTITAAGRARIAKAKTQALRRHLRESGPFNTLDLLAWMVLALGAATVTVLEGEHAWSKVRMDDLAARLVPPEGAASLNITHVENVATEALARLLFVHPTQPDPVPEWIGHASGADAALPRLDTPDLLRELSGAELKRLAAEHGIKPAKSVAGLREQLAGKLDKWRPAQFGAPGPKPRDP